MQSTPIEWATAVWNPTRGCRRRGEGCTRCYAEKIAARFNGPGLAYEGLTTNGRWNGTPRWLPEKFAEPLSWRKPERIFVNSMSDLFFEEFDAEAVIAPIFATMSRASWHTFIVLTKRYERAASLLADRAFIRAVDDARGPDAGDFSWPLPNVIVGGSISNQDEADRWAVCVASIPAVATALSIEPIIGPVDLTTVAHRATGYEHPDLAFTSVDVLRGVGTYPSSITSIPIDVEFSPIGWVIVGGESGPDARPCNVEWIRSIVEQCKAAGVPVFVKQLGADVRDRNDAGFEGDLEVWADGPDKGRPTNPSAWPHQHAAEDRIEHLTPQNWQGDAVRVHLRSRKGGDMSEWPEDLRVRQFPAGVVL